MAKQPVRRRKSILSDVFHVPIGAEDEFESDGIFSEIPEAESDYELTDVVVEQGDDDYIQVPDNFVITAQKIVRGTGGSISITVEGTIDDIAGVDKVETRWSLV